MCDLIDFFVSCLDLIFVWFSSESWLVVLPFCTMIVSVMIMFVIRLIGGRV